MSEVALNPSSLKIPSSWTYKPAHATRAELVQSRIDSKKSMCRAVCRAVAWVSPVKPSSSLLSPSSYNDLTPSTAATTIINSPISLEVRARTRTELLQSRKTRARLDGAMYPRQRSNAHLPTESTARVTTSTSLPSESQYQSQYHTQRSRSRNEMLQKRRIQDRLDASSHAPQWIPGIHRKPITIPIHNTTPGSGTTLEYDWWKQETQGGDPTTRSSSHVAVEDPSLIETHVVSSAATAKKARERQKAHDRRMFIQPKITETNPQKKAYAAPRPSYDHGENGSTTFDMIHNVTRTPDSQSCLTKPPANASTRDRDEDDTSNDMNEETTYVMASNKAKLISRKKVVDMAAHAAVSITNRHLKPHERARLNWLPPAFKIDYSKRASHARLNAAVRYRVASSPSVTPRTPRRMRY